jgi:hypothetical protein
VRQFRNLPALLAALALLQAPSTRAATTAKLQVGFAPYALGQATNVYFTLNILAPPGQIPPPLTQLEMRYPRDLGLDISGLGIKACARARLEVLGPSGCTAESYMGQGTAVAAIQIGPEVVHETAKIAILRAPELEGHIAMFFNLQATGPVEEQIVLPGLLLQAPPPYEAISISVPIIPTFPDAPDVALTRLTAHFGPAGLTYYEHKHHKLIPYKPQGILLPHQCPKEGFKFAAKLTFAEYDSILTEADIPCPVRHRRALTAILARPFGGRHARHRARAATFEGVPLTVLESA